MLFAFVVGHDEWMTRSESFLLKVQGGELDVDCLPWLEVANGDGDRSVEGGRCRDGRRTFPRLPPPWPPPPQQYIGCLGGAAFDPFGKTLDTV